MQGAVAHQVNGGLEYEHTELPAVTGEPERHLFVAAGDAAPERRAVQIVSAALGGEYRLSRAISADKDAVVIFRVLIEQPRADKVPDDLGRDTPLLKIGGHAAVVAVRRREGKRDRLFLWNGWRRTKKPCAAMIVQKILYSLRETLALEPLQEGDRVSAPVFRVAEPGAAVLDPQAVHFLGGVIAADPLDLIPQGGQQIGQIGLPGGLQLGLGKASICVRHQYPVRGSGVGLPYTVVTQRLTACTHTPL